MLLKSEQIKTVLHNLGFQKVGITPATETPEASRHLADWIDGGNHATMDWIPKRQKERSSVLDYFPEAKTVISAGLNYYTGNSKDVVGADLHVSNYAWGDDYHVLIKKQLLQALKSIQNSITGQSIKGIVCVDTSPVMEKTWAQRAGLGWQGKHTNLITRDYGSWIFLGEILLDAEVDQYDLPFEDDLCGSCTACLEACPTDALTEYQLDARRCISYLTIEHRGELPGEFRDQLHDWIYGCDICQEVCPWNQKFSRMTEEQAFAARPFIREASRSDWISMDADKFRKLFKNSPVKRSKLTGLKRNLQAITQANNDE